jgi:bleomycin hydrolase
LLKSLEKDFRTRPVNKIMMNALTRGNLQEISLNRNVLNTLDFNFSEEVKGGGAITDQKRAGTCWLFAELNWLRTFAAKKMNVENFEFSENHVIFWNKLERSNYFLEYMIQYRDRDWDDRRVYFLLDNPAPDGGDWHMIADIIDKYGLIPKSAMQDTFNRESSRFLNEVLYFKLREGAAQIRSLHKKGKPVSALRKVKDDVMKVCYRILAIMLGDPPRKFDFGYRDKKKKFHRDLGITPKEFYEKYVGIDTKEIYGLICCPTPETPFKKLYSAEFFANTIGGRHMLYLNLPIKTLKEKAIEVLKGKEACLFNADVVQECHSKEGILDTEVFDYSLIFDTPFEMEKTTRIRTLQTRLTHSMVFLGVDLVKEKPVKWKVENSWGESYGKKGIFVMSGKWFDEHVFAVLVQKKHLTKEMLEQFEQPAVTLPPWHPMI